MPHIALLSWMFVFVIGLKAFALASTCSVRPHMPNPILIGISTSARHVTERRKLLTLAAGTVDHHCVRGSGASSTQVNSSEA